MTTAVLTSVSQIGSDFGCVRLLPCFALRIFLFRFNDQSKWTDRSQEVVRIEKAGVYFKKTSSMVVIDNP